MKDELLEQSDAGFTEEQPVDLISHVGKVSTERDHLTFTSGADGHTVAEMMGIIATLPDSTKDRLRHVHGHKGNLAIVADDLDAIEAMMIASLSRDHIVTSVEVYSTDLDVIAFGIGDRARIVGGYQWG